MFTKLTDTTKAAIFSVVVLCLAVGTALASRVLGLPPDLGMWWVLWSCTPTVATLIMLLIVLPGRTTPRTAGRCWVSTDWA